MLVNLDIISYFSQTVHLCCTFPDRQLPEKPQLSLLLVFKTTNYTFFKHFQTIALTIDGETAAFDRSAPLGRFRVKDVAYLAESGGGTMRAVSS